MISENEIAKLVLDVAFKIHRQYGPGLFESVYEELFMYEWKKTEIPVLRQHPIPLVMRQFVWKPGSEQILLLIEK